MQGNVVCKLMKSRTAKKSTSHSKPRKGLSRTAKVVGATTVGALAGGLVAAALTNRKRSTGVGRTAQKLKGWVKTAATNPAMKSMAKGVAQQMVETQLGQRPVRKGPSASSQGAMMRSTGKGKKKK